MTHSDTLQKVESLTELLAAVDVDVTHTETFDDGNIRIDADVSTFNPDDLTRDEDGEIDPTGVGGGTEKGDI